MLHTRESLDLSIAIADYRVVAADLEGLAEIACESGESLPRRVVIGGGAGLAPDLWSARSRAGAGRRRALATAIRTQIGAARYADALYESAARPLADALHLIFGEERLL